MKLLISARLVQNFPDLQPQRTALCATLRIAGLGLIALIISCLSLTSRSLSWSAFYIQSASNVTVTLASSLAWSVAAASMIGQVQKSAVQSYDHRHGQSLDSIPTQDDRDSSNQSC
ncbi:hypothetical protein N7471_013625 [Penicillium samsonianum]|uniref:uncharacterized protein n=1 Tax=Penicillium samsonianum TaxID=1882272 RepID=UPI002548CBF1|nr:uncharacterized protein N7471_013625 [Penicillium samsonianum]KAJ6119005.1 hypothetical protein N7471_013625 [Penicillium samsonianum]